MESPENSYKLLSALYRLGLLALLVSFAMIPGFLAFLAAGEWAGAAAWVATLVVVAWAIRRNLQRQERTAWEALTAGRPDVDDKPPLLFLLFGMAFAGAGIVAWGSDMQHPAEGQPASFVEQFMLGAVFFGMGSSIFVMGVTAGLIRWGLRRELADLERRIAMRPDSAALQLELAAMLADRGTFKDALPALDKAIELDPRCVEAYVQRGRAHWMCDRYNEAIADLTRAIELDPNNADAYMYRSMAYEDSDQPELAKADEERGMELEGE